MPLRLLMSWPRLSRDCRLLTYSVLYERLVRLQWHGTLQAHTYEATHLRRAVALSGRSVTHDAIADHDGCRAVVVLIERLVQLIICVDYQFTRITHAVHYRLSSELLHLDVVELAASMRLLCLDLITVLLVCTVIPTRPNNAPMCTVHPSQLSSNPVITRTPLGCYITRERSSLQTTATESFGRGRGPRVHSPMQL